MASGAVLFATLLAGCSLPWSHQGPTELNVAFHPENNLLFLDNATIGNMQGRFAFASAAKRSAIDPPFAARLPRPGRRGYLFELGQREIVRFRPLHIPLHGVADALLGADAFPASAVSIDYRLQLITFDESGLHSEEMSVFSWTAEPAVDVMINDRHAIAIVDTASPETMVIPRSSLSSTGDRATVDITLADARFKGVSVRLADVGEFRIGNRLLSKYLVWIDYRQKQVGLWRDPRILGNL